jgi:hypothetical protein
MAALDRLVAIVATITSRGAQDGRKTSVVGVESPCHGQRPEVEGWLARPKTGTEAREAASDWRLAREDRGRAQAPRSDTGRDCRPRQLDRFPGRRRLSGECQAPFALLGHHRGNFGDFEPRFSAVQAIRVAWRSGLCGIVFARSATRWSERAPVAKTAQARDNRVAMAQENVDAPRPTYARVAAPQRSGDSIRVAHLRRVDYGRRGYAFVR